MEEEWCTGVVCSGCSIKVMITEREITVISEGRRAPTLGFRCCLCNTDTQMFIPKNVEERIRKQRRPQLPIWLRPWNLLSKLHSRSD